MSNSSKEGYDNTEVIFEPIKMDKVRDDSRGLSHGHARSSHGFAGVVEEEEEGTIQIQYGGPSLPSDEEMEAMKEKFRLEDAEKERESKKLINRIKSLFGCGG